MAGFAPTIAYVLNTPKMGDPLRTATLHFMSNTTPASSLICLEFPAVLIPYFSTTSFNFPRPAIGGSGWGRCCGYGGAVLSGFAGSGWLIGTVMADFEQILDVVFGGEEGFDHGAVGQLGAWWILVVNGEGSLVVAE
ncbi:hypothetical protein NC651_005769 [Populus alba x Populus x berolinensis]|nr:hypothetical protein NC651_005769 [Populus alba x Populus x berolinensis]